MTVIGSRRCGVCRWLRVLRDADGVQRIRKTREYQCLVPAPDKPIVPASMMQVLNLNWPPARTRMAPQDGVACPTFEPGRPAA